MKVTYENRNTSLSYQYADDLSPLPHLHDQIEIVYVENGSVIAYADQNRYALQKGDLYIAFPNQIHHYHDASNGIYHVMIASTDALYDVKGIFSEKLPVCNVTRPEPDSLLCRSVFALKTVNLETNKTAFAGYLNLLISDLLPRLTYKSVIKAENSTLKRILNYCAEHFTEDISLDSMADELLLSKYYISRLLNQSINLTLSDYICTLRIRLSCELLEDTDKKIADISEDVGFGTIRSFNRAFQRAMNTTPAQYRTLIRKEISDN